MTTWPTGGAQPKLPTRYEEETTVSAWNYVAVDVHDAFRIIKDAQTNDENAEIGHLRRKQARIGNFSEPGEEHSQILLNITGIQGKRESD